ncbi:hypothetical protein QBC36DRAFT_349065 [Triangularia setosa]|uniref:LITAF domain-containing protein n=1 Tax=Triangularia setosa TaxID=2587417 RepID=A0AAN6W093_9PEZI|nr:hypothetical protein QBC36DRAFT_349065 [Podospora setosa]
MLGNAHFDRVNLPPPPPPPKVDCPFCRRIATVRRKEIRKALMPWRRLCCILLAPICFCGLVRCWDQVDFFYTGCHSKGSGLVVYGPGGQSQRYYSSTVA